MPIMFNTILREVGLSLPDVRLVRHIDNRAQRGRSPYELWRDNRSQFELYQSIQSVANRPKFAAPIWASFVVNLNGETMFAGLYTAGHREVMKKDTPMITRDGFDKAGSCDIYDLTLLSTLSDLAGRLLVDWGLGTRAWVQHAKLNNKPILELRRTFQEPSFPGFLNFIQPLSKINNLPTSWYAALKSSRGVYLLTCPKTKEQYIGSATGEEGFWGRWQNYVQTGHGNNVGLKSREPSDYQVSILEVAGTSETIDDILAMEGRWQSKLQSREMGLNRNSAGSCARSRLSL